MALGGGGNDSLEGGSLLMDDVSESSNNNNAVGKSIRPSKTGIRAAMLCPWAACSGGPGLGYQFELLTLGSDRRIAHWGVRYKADHTDVLLVPHFANVTRTSTANLAEVSEELDADGEGNGDDDEAGMEESSLTAKSILGADHPMETDLLGVSFHSILFTMRTFLLINARSYFVCLFGRNINYRWSHLLTWAPVPTRRCC